MVRSGRAGSKLHAPNHCRLGTVCTQGSYDHRHRGRQSYGLQSQRLWVAGGDLGAKPGQVFTEVPLAGIAAAIAAGFNIRGKSARSGSSCTAQPRL